MDLSNQGNYVYKVNAANFAVGDKTYFFELGGFSYDVTTNNKGTKTTETFYPFNLKDYHFSY
jgi:hypothetical protein